MKYPRMSCKDCENRTPTCHCTCEEYKIAKQELDKFNEEVKKKRDFEYLMMDYDRDNVRKRRWSR